MSFNHLADEKYIIDTVIKYQLFIFVVSKEDINIYKWSYIYIYLEMWAAEIWDSEQGGMYHY